jgi:hypothetical protein
MYKFNLIFYILKLKFIISFNVIMELNDELK